MPAMPIPRIVFGFDSLLKYDAVLFGFKSGIGHLKKHLLFHTVLAI